MIRPESRIRPDLRIRTLSLADESELIRARASLARTDPAFDFAYGFEGGMTIADYVAFLERTSRGEGLAGDHVPGTLYFAWLGAHGSERIVGRVSIRHRLNDNLARFGGHVGYATLEEYRGRGIARAMLGFALERLRDLGIDRALVTCDDTNVASARTIECHGGILESLVEIAPDKPPKRRYWIDLASESAPPPARAR